DRFNAVLYLGPPGEMTLSKLSRALCDDHTYLEMRLARLALIPSPPSAAVSQHRCSRNTVSIPKAQLSSQIAIQKRHKWCATPLRMRREGRLTQTDSLLNHENGSSPFFATMGRAFWLPTVHCKS